MDRRLVPTKEDTVATNREIWQLARILGKSDFLSCLSLAREEDLQSLTPAQLERVHELARKNLSKLTRTLVHEAAADDSIRTASEAQQWLDERLNGFGELLPDGVRKEVREGFALLTAAWG